MLMITRKEGEEVQIGDVSVKIYEIRGNKVRLAILAPPDVPVRRKEKAPAEVPVREIVN